MSAWSAPAPDSDYMVRSYHDPLLWRMGSAELNSSTVDGWALNELRAEQLIRDAIALDPEGRAAHVLDACNLMARFAEYRDVQDVVSTRVAEGAC